MMLMFHKPFGISERKELYTCNNIKKKKKRKEKEKVEGLPCEKPAGLLESLSESRAWPGMAL